LFFGGAALDCFYVSMVHERPDSAWDSVCKCRAAEKQKEYSFRVFRRYKQATPTGFLSQSRLARMWIDVPFVSNSQQTPPKMWVMTRHKYGVPRLGGTLHLCGRPRHPKKFVLRRSEIQDQHLSCGGPGDGHETA